MPLSTKPDTNEAILHWEYFWRGELYKRPVVVTTVPKSGIEPADIAPIYDLRYYHVVKGMWEERLSLIDQWLDQVTFPGDMIPMFSPDFGPDQWAAFFGAELKFGDESLSTNWVDPIVEDWNAALPLTFNPQNRTFQTLLRYSESLARHGEGRYLVGQIDAHSNADALSALRGTERFLMDLYDCPDLVAQALLDMRQSYKLVHEAVAKAGRMGGQRGYGHYGFWHEKPFQVVQSDVICMLSQKHFRTLILPTLEEEFACHNRAYFHLDGPDALRHLDDILQIPGYWILQWQPGDGQKPNWQWLDVLKKAQAAGKAIHAFGTGLNLEAIRSLQHELDPARVVYSPELRTEAEADTLLKWLERNT